MKGYIEKSNELVVLFPIDTVQFSMKKTLCLSSNEIIKGGRGIRKVVERIGTNIKHKKIMCFE